jgi:ribosome-binding protein aMBF1 (putative translation factor)
MYDCDICGKPTRRTHFSISYGLDTYACDECAGYDPEAYGEEPDTETDPE